MIELSFEQQHFGFALQETGSQETVSYHESQPTDVLHPCCSPVIYSLSCEGKYPFPPLETSASVLRWKLISFIKKSVFHFSRTSMNLQNICFRRMCLLQAITSVLWALILEWWIRGTIAISVVLDRWFLILQKRYVKRWADI